MPQKENKAVILIDLKSYPLEAVYAAAYSFIDKAYIYLESAPKSKIRISLKGKKILSKGGLEAMKGEFLNELLSSALRSQISKNNRKVREYIVAGAIASAAGEMAGELLDLEEESSERNAPKVSVSRQETEVNDYGKQLLKRQRKNIWEKDPLGIAVPWEEKYAPKNRGKNKRK